MNAQERIFLDNHIAKVLHEATRIASEKYAILDNNGDTTFNQADVLTEVQNSEYVKSLVELYVGKIVIPIQDKIRYEKRKLWQEEKHNKTQDHGKS